ncbi:hypothetical protein [Dictyoglomus thermophilum]|nr:hypothetical protein [Dictyoglomus thermophilum]
MILSYHEIRNLSPEKAREIVIRAINGPLHNLSKNLILFEIKTTSSF